MTSELHLFLLVSAGSVLALAGGLAFLFIKPLRSTLTKYSMAFASGVLLSVALLGLLPEAVHQLGEKAFLAALIAFVAVYVFESYFFDLHHHEHEHEGEQGHGFHQLKKSSALLVIVGDTVHNFIDGAAIAGAFLVDTGLGQVMAISTFLHEIPHEIGDFGILLKMGYSRKKVILINFFSALSSFIGAALVYFLMADESYLGVLLAITAGMFLYLGASDFLPKVTLKKSSSKQLLAFLLGCLLIYFSLALIPHSHNYESSDESQMNSHHDSHYDSHHELH
jgi:zinc and cadmium transporter